MSIAKELPPKTRQKGGTATTDVIQQWLDESSGEENRRAYARSALAWCRRLPQLADELPAKTWQKLFEHLVHAAIDANATSGSDAPANNDPVAWQLLAGELPLAMASFFPKIKECRRLLPLARKSLSAGLNDLLDGDGLLHAKHFDDLRPLLALWIRCLALGERWKRGCWTPKADAQFRRFVRNSLRLTRGNGSGVFGDESADSDGIALVTTGVAMAGNAADHAIASLMFDGKSKSKSRKKNERSLATVKLPEATVHSEWAATALLRPSWESSAPRLSVLYPDASCRMELAIGKDVLWSGEWEFDVRIDGAAMSPKGEWAETCWVSDEDADYLELELELTEGIRVQRHFFLARQEGFLLLADSVLGTRFASLDYCSRLPLGQRTTFRRACETREGFLASRKIRAVGMPLALSEWAADASAGPNSSFEAVADRDEKTSLELRQSALGNSLFAPMFFDLDRRRFNKPLTWRQLTVAGSLKKQSAETAVGYRVAIGSQQWLIYRSLTPPCNRTLLGHNLSSEMLIGRFTREGEIETLIEIE